MKNPHEMNFGELKRWLSDRLQLRGAAAADIDIRRDEAPYERPVKLWTMGTGEFRNDFLRAVLDLIAEAAAAPWEPKHFHELALLIEAGNLWEAVKPLEGIAHSRHLLQHEHGAQFHMLALRTLLALGWKGTTDFWLAQNELVAGRWPEIIFDGLAQNDLTAAFAQLPKLATDTETMRRILNLLPGIMRDLKLNMLNLQGESRRIVANLAPEASAALREWFRLRNYPLISVVESKHPALYAALYTFHGADNTPKAIRSKLCTPAEPELLAT